MGQINTLESIVLSLADSQALVKAGVVLDTALSWYPVEPAEERIDDSTGTVYGREPQEGDPTEFVFMSGECDNAICGAPVLSESLDAIRVKADAMEVKADRGMELERHEYGGQIIYEIVGQGQGMCEDDWLAAEGKAPTDLQAAAALLMEVSK